MYLLKRNERMVSRNDTSNEAKIGFITTSTIIGSVLLIIATILYSYVAAKRITKPINQIVDCAQAAATGNLTIDTSTLSYQANSRYEIDRLTKSFSEMMNNLKVPYNPSIILERTLICLHKK